MVRTFNPLTKRYESPTLLPRQHYPTASTTNEAPTPFVRSLERRIKALEAKYELLSTN